jgi:4a-hydroxytetrahydrobiopterin dehydratase
VVSVAQIPAKDRPALVAGLDGWRLADDGRSIARSLVFEGFAEAFRFMTSVAILAERADHHPEWSNLYNRVDIVLTTHDADGLSQRDIDLARSIDRLVAKA